jgi:protein subunit release factor B
MGPDYALADDELQATCRIDSFRAQGPGGQHTNRTDSAVRMTHVASGVVAQCQDHRERARNQKSALQRLRLRLALTQRGESQIAWLKPYHRGTRLNLGANAAGYPLVVAVVLDALEQAQGALREAAEALGVSSSQIAKLLTDDKEVHAAANNLRARFGLGAIHA